MSLADNRSGRASARPADTGKRLLISVSQTWLSMVQGRETRDAAYSAYLRVVSLDVMPGGSDGPQGRYPRNERDSFQKRIVDYSLPSRATTSP